MDTTFKGDITESQVLAALLQAGKTVLLPFGQSHRYDLVMDDGGSFHRVQCKTGRLRNGVIVVNGSSIQAPHLGGRRRDYRGQADLFGVYCPETNQVYLVPVAEVPRNEFRLRVAHTHQTKGVRYAKDYVVKPNAVIAQLAEH